MRPRGFGCHEDRSARTGRSARGAFLPPRGGATGRGADPFLRLAESSTWSRKWSRPRCVDALAVVASPRNSGKPVGLGAPGRQEQGPRRAPAHRDSATGDAGMGRQPARAARGDRRPFPGHVDRRQPAPDDLRLLPSVARSREPDRHDAQDPLRLRHLGDRAGAPGFRGNRQEASSARHCRPGRSRRAPRAAREQPAHRAAGCRAPGPLPDLQRRL